MDAGRLGACRRKGPGDAGEGMVRRRTPEEGSEEGREGISEGGRGRWQVRRQGARSLSDLEAGGWRRCPFGVASQPGPLFGRHALRGELVGQREPGPCLEDAAIPGGRRRARQARCFTTTSCPRRRQMHSPLLRLHSTSEIPHPPRSRAQAAYSVQIPLTPRLTPAAV